MVNWFAGLFEELQPRVEELISLQEEIMQVFTSPYTKPVNVMLQQLKKIASEGEFRYQEFIERATTLFFSSPKNSLLTIYSIFEQIVTGHPEMKEACCIPLCQLFLKKDESLQKKAASFISKYGDASSSTLQETLLSYQSEIFQGYTCFFHEAACGRSRPSRNNLPRKGSYLSGRQPHPVSCQ